MKGDEKVADFSKLLQTRRSIRDFQEKEVPVGIIKEVIKDSCLAPSSGNGQPWEFIIIEDRNVIDQIADLKGTMEGMRGGKRRIAIEKNLYNNSSIVAICNKKGIFGPPGSWMAAENIALAARGEGIGCVMTIFGGEYKEKVEHLKRLQVTLDPFELSDIIDRKLDHIFSLATQRIPRRHLTDQKPFLPHLQDEPRGAYNSQC